MLNRYSWPMICTPRIPKSRLAICTPVVASVMSLSGPGSATAATMMAMPTASTTAIVNTIRLDRTERSLIHSEWMTAVMPHLRPSTAVAEAEAAEAEARRRPTVGRAGLVLLGVRGELEEGFLERAGLRAQLVQHETEARRQLADLLRGLAGHVHGVGHHGGHLRTLLLERLRQAPHLRAADTDPVPGRLRHELRRRPVEQQPALADHHEVVGHQLHLAEQVAGHEDRAAVGGEALQEAAEPVDALGVESVRRLVEQQGARVAEEGPGEAQALLHAEGELPDAPLGGRLEPDEPEHLVDAGLRDLVRRRQRPEVVVGLARRVHVAGVEERPDLPHGERHVREVLAVDGRRSRRRAVEAEDHPHRGRLAGTVRPEEAGDLAVGDIERQVVDGQLGSVPLVSPDTSISARSGGRGGVRSAGQYRSAGVAPAPDRPVPGLPSGPLG